MKPKMIVTIILCMVFGLSGATNKGDKLVSYFLFVSIALFKLNVNDTFFIG